jgi:hypothetical protein
MLRRRRNELSILGLAFVACLLTAPPVLAQAPPSAERFDEPRPHFRFFWAPSVMRRGARNPPGSRKGAIHILV